MAEDDKPINITKYDERETDIEARQSENNIASAIQYVFHFHCLCEAITQSNKGSILWKISHNN